MYLWVITSEHDSCSGGINSRHSVGIWGKSVVVTGFTEEVPALLKEILLPLSSAGWDRWKYLGPSFFPLELNILAIPAFSNLFH